MNCLDIYNILFNAVNAYMDSILIKEDPSDFEKKEYDQLKYWTKDIQPNEEVKKILTSLTFKESGNDQEKGN